MSRRSPIFPLLLAALIGLPLALASVPATAEEVGAGMGGGGPLSALVFLHLEGLNEILEANGYAPLNEPVPLMGGGGFGGLVEDLRFGGLGFGGEISSALSQKTANLSFNFGGIMIERGLLAAKRYSLSIGAVIGSGDAELTLVDHQSTSFEEAVSDPPNVFLSRGFFGIQAHVGMDLSLLDWIMLKINLGYLWTFGDPWKQDGRLLPGPPHSLNAPVLQVMITFGGREELREEEGVESGLFVIEQAGKRMGQERFRLTRTEAGPRLESTIELELLGHSLELGQQLQLTPWLSPAHYLLKGQTPQGEQWIDAALEDGNVHIEAMTEEKREERELAGEPPLIILDNNVTSHYLMLYKLVKAQEEAGRDFQGTAVVPQALTTFPLKVGAAQSALLKSGEQTISVERYTVQFGDFQIYVYGQRETFFAVEFPTQQMFSYRQDLLPEGIEVTTEERGAIPPEEIREKELAFISDGLRLVGTLTLPKQVTGPVPAVLFIHGSGPVDRDENMPGLKIDFFNTVAHRLAQTGIGSFRYDKRGVGESEGDFLKASMADLLNDARAALQFLKDQEEIDPDQVFLLGHSEGGTLGPILAAEGLVEGLITVAGLAHPLDWILVEQTRLIDEASGLPPERVEKDVEESRQFVQFVKETEGDWEDHTYDEAKEWIPSITKEKYEGMKQGMSLHWWREHFAHDSLQTITQVKMPLLILQGEKDLQVPQGEAELLAQALREAGNENVEVHIFPDLNHVMRYHPEEPNVQYRHLDEPVDERVLQIISSWIRDQIQTE